MPETRVFEKLAFAPDFGFAIRHDGSRINFTRTERRVLQDLAAHPERLRTRSELLDATSEPGSAASDRNIDFTITRLRTKLGDSARRPIYIATRYGEGYVWIARTPPPAGDNAPKPFVTVGPISLPEADTVVALACRTFADAVAVAFRSELALDRPVHLEPAYAPAEDDPAKAPSFHLALVFVVGRDGIDCVSVLRRPGGRILCVRRDRDIAAADPEATAGDHLTALWRAVGDLDAPAGPEAEPVDVRLALAGEPFEREDERDLPTEVTALKGEAFPAADIFRRNERRLRRLVADGQGDARTRLMLAVATQSRYIVDGWRFLANEDPRASDEAEQAELVFGILPDLVRDPEHAMTAAKVIAFLGPAYRTMALDIAEEAFERSTAIAHALSILGPLRCMNGDFAGGLELLEQARRLCKPGSMFERYVVSYLCQGRMASGDFEGKDRELELLTRSPLAKGPYRLVYATPYEGEPSLPVRLHLRLSSGRFARSTLLWSYYICARLYAGAQARENLILGLAGHLRRRFGDRVVHPDVAAAIPAVLSPDILGPR